MLRRLENQKLSANVLRELRKFILGYGRHHNIRLSHSEIILSGPWGRNMPLRDVADGFKSTLLWLSDFIGWALADQPNVGDLSEIEGIVLIDELEQHLHPSWQDVIISQLRKAFPRVHMREAKI
jgi:predicted ATP-binding protein involved in virulence